MLATFFLKHGFKKRSCQEYNKCPVLMKTNEYILKLMNTFPSSIGIEFTLKVVFCKSECFWKWPGKHGNIG